ncbi:hypothetical protein [Clostridium sp. DL1XJH146]
MNIFKSKKGIMICITLITLVEMYFAYKVAAVYAGVYQIGIFIPFIFQPFGYFRFLFGEEKTYPKAKILVLALVSIMLPVVIYSTLPSYTYDDGKQLIEESVQSSEEIVFLDTSKDHATIVISNNPKQLFVSDRAYYYEIKAIEQNEYFMVNPIDGQVGQLSENYWE